MCPYASQFMVFGSERNYCVALITLDPDAIAGWAEENGLGGSPTRRSSATPKTREMVSGYVDQLNSQLNRWETIKKFELLDHDLTVESGELTPSMKVKRKVVEDNYAPRSTSSTPDAPTVTVPCPGDAWRRCLPAPAGAPLRPLRARAVLRGPLRLLRLQHLHGRPSSGGGGSQATYADTRSPRSEYAAAVLGAGPSRGRDGLLRRRHADAAACRGPDPDPRGRSTVPSGWPRAPR